VNCSKFFRNVTVFARMVTAYNRAHPHRLNDCDYPRQDRQQVRYRCATGAVQGKKVSAKVMSVSIDHRLGMAIDQKSARQSMLRRNL
jgi:hypothetical protein